MWKLVAGLHFLPQSGLKPRTGKKETPGARSKNGTVYGCFFFGAV